MKNAVILLFGSVIGLGLSVLVFMKGWGMEAHSWAWIIGGGIGLQLFIRIIELIARESK